MKGERVQLNPILPRLALILVVVRMFSRKASGAAITMTIEKAVHDNVMSCPVAL